MKRSLLYVAGALMGLLAAGTGVAQKKYGPGVSDTEIKIGQNAPFSGPASGYAILTRVELAYLKQINDAGGVNGRKITLLARDDGYSPPKTLEVIRQLVEEDQVLAIVSSFGTPTNAAIQKYLNNNKIPQILLQSGASRWNDPAHFPWTTPYTPSYYTEALILANYILQKKPDAKIGVLYQADDIGKDYLRGLHDGFGDKADKLIVKEIAYQVTDPTVDSQILSLQSAGADAVILAATNKFGAQAIRKMHEIGWKPEPAILTATVNSVAGVLVPAGLEASKDWLTTSIYKVPEDPTWANDPGMNDYLTFMKTNFPNDNASDISAITGYSTIQVAVQVLKQCGDNLTRENVLKQALNLYGQKLPMLINGITLQTTPENYELIKQTRLARFDGKSWVMFGDVIGTPTAQKRP